MNEAYVQPAMPKGKECGRKAIMRGMFCLKGAAKLQAARAS